MSTRFKINYNDFNEDASPIKSDVKIKTSHRKLVSQSANARARAKWGKENPEKALEIVVSGGNKTLNMGIGIHALSKKQMSKHAKKLYKQGKGFAKLTKEEKSIIGKKYGKQNLCSEIICEKC